MHSTIRLLGKVSAYEISIKLTYLRASDEKITDQSVEDAINSVLDEHRREYRDVFPMNPTSDEYRDYLRVVVNTLETTGWGRKLRRRRQGVPVHA